MDLLEIEASLQRACSAAELQVQLAVGAPLLPHSPRIVMSPHCVPCTTPPVLSVPGRCQHRSLIVCTQVVLVDKELTACFVVEEADELLFSDLLFYLARKRLPFYMVPSRMCHMPSLPTRNGKLWRSELINSVPEQQEEEEDTELTECERVVSEAWFTVLGVHPTSKRDNFLKLGGETIAAAAVVSPLLTHCWSTLSAHPLPLLVHVPRMIHCLPLQILCLC